MSKASKVSFYRVMSIHFPVDYFIAHSGSETKPEPAAAMTAGDSIKTVLSKYSKRRWNSLPEDLNYEHRA